MQRIVQMLCVLGGLAAMGHPAVASAQDKPMIAILPLQTGAGLRLSESETSLLTDVGRGQAVKVLGDGYIVQTEQNMQRILSTQGLSLEQCMAKSGDCEVEIARKLQADYAVAGRIRKAFGELKLTIQLYETGSGALLEQHDTSARDAKDLESAVRKGMTALLSKLPGAAGAGPSAGLPAMPMEMRDASGADWQPSAAASVTVVKFSSTPAGAMVMLDGKPICTATPCSKEVAAGIRNVAMHLERHVSREEMLDTSSQKKLHWKLEEDFARLSVNTEPPGLEVRVDGKPAGKSPIQNLELSTGGHVIEAGGDRCRQSHKKQISLSGGETATETLEPVMIPAGLMVRAKDEDGNALEGDVFVDGEKIGRTLEAIRVSVCAEKVEVRLDAGGSKEVSIHLQAQETETVEALFSRRGNEKLIRALLFDFRQYVWADSATIRGLYQEACQEGAALACQWKEWHRADGATFEDALRVMPEACEEGDSVACVVHGWALSQARPDGAPDKDASDPARAAQLFEKACGFGLLRGCAEQGRVFGNGIEENHAEAMRLFQKACDGGNMRGCSNLGINHENGDGVRKDLSEANRLYRKACDGGYEKACEFLR